MNINDFNTPEEKLQFLSDTEEGRTIVRQIQEIISDAALAAIDGSPGFKQTIDSLKEQGFVVNVGVSIAVGFETTAPVKGTFSKSDKDFLDGMGISWEGKDEERNP